MTERILGPSGKRRRRLWMIAPITAMAMLVGLFVTSAAVAVSDTDCTTASTLPVSTFEIDAIVPPAANAKKNTLPTGGANLGVNDGDCLDWAAVTEVRQADSPSGSGDESFGQGTAENDAVPTIVSGSIPPNKSDLKNFGVYQENTANKTFVAVFWSRINSPSGHYQHGFRVSTRISAGAPLRIRRQTSAVAAPTA